MGGRFSSVAAMDEHLIMEWNRTVPGTGIVYHLGDFAFAGSQRIADICGQLNGEIRLITGNHDNGLAAWVRESFFRSIDPYLEITVKRDSSDRGRKLVLCHYAFRTWNRGHYGTGNLHGHSHGNLPHIGKQLDVGVDDHRISRDLRPYTFEEIDAYLDTENYTPVDHHAYSSGSDETQTLKDEEQFG